MTFQPLRLHLIPAQLAVCRLLSGDAIPEWAAGEFFSITRTAEELSVVCDAKLVPDGVRHEGGWRALQVAGPLDFALTGVLASIAVPLAEAGVSIFAVSTFDTDYVLVKQNNVERAAQVLQAAGHRLTLPIPEI
jgi:hypothetical protein